MEWVQLEHGPGTGGGGGSVVVITVGKTQNSADVTSLDKVFVLQVEPLAARDSRARLSVEGGFQETLSGSSAGNAKR